MAHELTIDLTAENLCKEIKFCDHTLEFIQGTGQSVLFGVSPSALNGYGWLGNFGMNDVVSTQLDYLSLDGSVSGTLFSGNTFLPSVPGNFLALVLNIAIGDTLQINVGANTILSITSTTNDVETFVGHVIAAINATSTSPNWVADNYGNLIVIYSTDVSGASLDGTLVTTTFSGNPLDIDVQNDVVGRGGQADRCIVVPNTIGDGIYEVTYQVTDGTTVIEKSIMFLNDCNIRACLLMKIVNTAKESGSCCGGCGSGISQEKVNWLYAQLSAVQVMFDEGQYACADAILRSLNDKCSNLCSNC